MPARSLAPPERWRPFVAINAAFRDGIPAVNAALEAHA
jgi:hypothetical protein